MSRKLEFTKKQVDDLENLREMTGASSINGVIADALTLYETLVIRAGHGELVWVGHQRQNSAEFRFSPLVVAWAKGKH